MNTRMLSSVSVVALLPLIAGCPTLPITAVMQIEDGVFVEADLPQPGGSGDSPAIDELTVYAREDQGFRLEAERETAAAQLGVGLVGYSGHFLIAESDCGDLARNFTMTVTSGTFLLQAVLIAEGSIVGNVATTQFEVLIRGVSRSERYAVEAGLKGIEGYLTGALGGLGGWMIIEYIVGEGVDEITMGECPQTTIQRDADEVTFLADYGDGCIVPGTEIEVSGTESGTGSIAGRSVNGTFDRTFFNCASETGSAQTHVIAPESEQGFETSVENMDLWGNHITAAGTGAAPGFPEALNITLTSITGTVARPKNDVEASAQYENLLLLTEYVTAVNFTPSSGTMMLTITSAEDTGSVIVVTFTEQSPENDVVLISVNGEPEIEWLLD